jgi:glycosyltransferase involved in cell wall biosynthesis
MACGVPLIATSNTGAEDLFTDGREGFVVPIRDPLAIREKILHLYHDPDHRATMAANALSTAQSLRNWSVYGEQVLEAYRVALARDAA